MTTNLYLFQGEELEWLIIELWSCNVYYIEEYLFRQNIGHQVRSVLLVVLDTTFGEFYWTIHLTTYHAKANTNSRFSEIFLQIKGFDIVTVTTN